MKALFVFLVLVVGSAVFAECNPEQQSLLEMMKNFCDKCTAGEAQFCGEPFSGRYKSTCEGYEDIRSVCAK